MNTDRILITNKVHTATENGLIGDVRDLRGRRIKATCGQTSGKYAPNYIHPDNAVTCKKCLSD